MSDSIKIKLSNYAVLEYSYGTDEKLISDVNFQKISNTTKNINIFPNDNIGASFSNNSLDYTFIELNNTDRVGHCDIDRSFELHELDDSIDLTSDLEIPTSYNVKYDTIKIHLLSGFYFNNIGGIGVRISGEENSGLKSYLLSHIYTLEENTITRNPKPYTSGNLVYDRYIEIKVPSLSYINEQYYNLSTYTNKALATYLTSDGKGFKKESPILVEFFQFFDFEEKDDKLTYRWSKLSEGAISQINETNLISCQVSESDEGDYFEYFAKYDGEFIADYISELNSQGKIYTILHELAVYENFADLTRIKVQELNNLQNTDFDKPNQFRPIVSDNAYSFIIEYTMRLINQTEDTQIIKTSSMSCDTTQARKYGRKLGIIQVKESSAPTKIYNRIAESPYKINVNKTKQAITKIKVISEVIRTIDSYNVAITADNSIIDIEDSVSNGILKDNNFIFGNGNGLIYLSKFDNHLKLNFFNRNSKDNDEPLPLDTFILQSEDTPQVMAIVFYGNSNTKKYIYSKKNSLNGNSISFHIPSHEAEKITNYTNRKFNIIYINALEEEISLYEGIWSNDVEEYKQLKDKEISETAQDRIAAMNKTFTDITTKFDNILTDIRNKPLQNITNVTNNIQNITNNSNSNSSTSNSDNRTINNITNNTSQNNGATAIKKIDYKIDNTISSDDKVKEDEGTKTKIKILADIGNSENFTIGVLNELITTGKKSLLDDGKIAGSVNIASKGNSIDIKDVNLTELPGKKSVLDSNTSIKNITPTFLTQY